MKSGRGIQVRVDKSRGMETLIVRLWLKSDQQSPSFTSSKRQREENETVMTFQAIIVV
jgi:hypothetical protein